MDKLKRRAQRIIDNCNGDIKFAKKVASNAAYISNQQGSKEDFSRDTEIFQNIEKIASKGYNK